MEKTITRRDLLKALIAGSGGIVAAGFVPEKWLKPVIKSGVLPVHAQASTPEPTASPEPTPSPTPTQNSVEGIGLFNIQTETLFAEAFVSAVPFTFPGMTNLQSKYKLASPKKGVTVPTDQPVEGVEVTLWINDFEYSEKKTTDSDGHVEWSEISNWEIPADAPSTMVGKIILKFVIEGDEDTFDILLPDVD